MHCNFRTTTAVLRYLEWLAPRHSDLEFIIEYDGKKAGRLLLLVAIHQFPKPEEYYVVDAPMIKQLFKSQLIDDQTRRQALRCLKKTEQFQHFLVRAILADPAAPNIFGGPDVTQIVPHRRDNNFIRTAWQNTGSSFAYLGFNDISATLTSSAFASSSPGPFRSVPSKPGDAIPLRYLFGIDRLSHLDAA